MIKTYSILIMLSVLIACKEVFEKDISDDSPLIILPSNDASYQNNPVFFKWGELDGATKYRIQIVSPNFDDIEAFPIDSIIGSTEIYFNLDSNTYQVRLQAFNAGYESKFTDPVSFALESGQSQINNVSLISPQNASFENSSFDNQFEWQFFTNATSYEFSLRSGNDFAMGDILYQENQIASNSINLSNQFVLMEGDYVWGVKAYTSNSETNFSIFTLFIDETIPNIPSLLSPSDNSFQNIGSLTFTWNNGTDPGNVNSEVISTIEIASDINFNSIVDSESLTGETFDFNFNNQGAYYWRVFNEDEAGNIGDMSQIYSFTIN